MEEKVVLTLSEIEKRLTDISDYDKKKNKPTTKIIMDSCR